MSTTDPSQLRRTPLSEVHPRFGARMVEFGGWWMPVQYSSILEEHHAVRKTAGLFDISHMGEFWVSGPKALEWLNGILANDLARIQVGQGQYSFLLNERGGVIDDLILYRTDASTYLLIVNASKVEEDAAWLQSKLPSDGVFFANESDLWAGLALQGPASSGILSSFLGIPSDQLPRRSTIRSFFVGEIALWIARTGYTGEDGFELFFDQSHAETVWCRLLETGASGGLKPCGLGCRDTLRLESCYPLNGNDLSPDRTPLEAGLGKFVSLTKPSDYPGKSILLQQQKDGLKTKLVAFKPTTKGAPPRSHYPVFCGDKQVGEVTSGSLSPTLQWGIGMAYVEASVSTPGTALELEVRGNRQPVLVVEKPFYQRPKQNHSCGCN